VTKALSICAAGDQDPRVSDEPKLPDVRERGAEKDGQPQLMDRRLFMQLLAFDCVGELGAYEAVKNLGAALDRRQVPAVIYEDVNDPTGIALLSLSEDPSDFVTRVRPVFAESSIAGLRLRHDLTMLGRTYSSGFEPDLEYWLLRRPRETVFNEAWPWAVWYPLRRSGAFEKLEPRDKGAVLREHATIGKAYGQADLAHDIRLACHGLDANDNEFVIGLIGRELHPLSHVVQSMRRTRQTSEFIVQMGPFFVGRAAWRSATR
jgi:chlorite dismutase